MTTLWDTTGTEVVKALAAERRHAGAVSSGLALSLVGVVDERHVEEAERSAMVALAEHPCRLLLVVRHRPDALEPRLDAEVYVGGELGPGEVVVMRMSGPLAERAESVVLPLLAPDAPVVTWWFGAAPDRIATDPLGVMAERRITDALAAPDPLQALQARSDDYAPGDTDLSWTRTTRWRSLCASAFDSFSGDIESLVVSGLPTSPTRALLAGWLRARLDHEVQLVDNQGPGTTGVELRVGGATMSILRTNSRTAVVSTTGQPDRTVPLPRRDLGDLLTEELRRLDSDDAYAEALQATVGSSGLCHRPSRREQLWTDQVAP